VKQSFLDLCANGGHWCKRCSRYVIPIDSDQGLPLACPYCGGHRIRFDPPVPGFKPDEEFQTDPKKCHA
jgi:DNA-directed RNA polymerase subunit RPC12/RpoP